MASYNATINLAVAGASQLDRVLARVGELDTLARRLSANPINVFGRGAAGDIARTALKPFQDISRAIENNASAAANSVAKTNLLASTFRTLASNVKIASKEYEDFIRVAGRAAAAAETQNKALETAIDAERRAALGLQPQDVRDLEVARRKTFVENERRRRSVAEAERAVNKAAAGTDLERRAITQLVTAMELENKARSRRNFLIAQEVASRRQVIATANAGVGMQGPALPRYMMTGPSSPIGGRLRGRGGGAAGGTGSRLGGAISGSIIGGAFPLLFGQGAGAATGGAIGGLFGGLLGPGGSFAGSLLGTLLGDIASRGQAIKTLGQDMGLAADQTQKLSAAFKTANTDVEKFTAVIQNIRGIGLELEDQVKAIELVTRLTELYGGSFEKTGNAITSALESGKVSQATLNQLTSENIKIQDALAAKYNVSRSQILQMAKDGKISVQDLIDTLVVLGNTAPQTALKQQNAFEQAYERIATAAAQATQNVLNEYSKTSAALASSGKGLETLFTSIFSYISTGIADLILGIGELSAQAARGLDPIIAGFINIQNSLIGAANAVPLLDSSIITFAQNALAVLNPVGFLIDKIRGAGQTARESFIGPEVPDRLKRAPLTSFRAPAQLPPSGGGGGAGPKPPEDRTAQLREEFAAIVAIGQVEDKVRDLLFDGRELLAAEVELEKELADIERDRNKALLGANYESERMVINKIAEARTADAQLKTEDKIREIRQKRFEQELQTQEAIRNSIQSFVDVRQQQELQLQYSKTFARLVTEGMLPAEAERIANYEKLIAEQTKGVELQIQTTQAAILEAQARGLSVAKLQEQLDLLTKQRDAIAGQAALGPGAAQTESERMVNAIASMQGEFNLLISSTNQLTAAATSVGDAFANSFKGIVSGSMTAQESLAGFFQSVANYFLDMAGQIIKKWIEMTILNNVLKLFPGGGGGFAPLSGAQATGFNFDVGAMSIGPAFGGFFANGGPVSGGTAYMVGERGPELFVPGRSGTIIPNERMGGVGGTTNVVVNVDAKGSSVQGDDGRANELGRVVSAAVQSEIIKQQRPGGLLAGTR